MSDAIETTVTDWFTVAPRYRTKKRLIEMLRAIRWSCTMSEPQATKDLLREHEVSDGINVIIDDRFCALFPMECRAQVEHLIASVNRAHQSRMKKR